MVHWGNSGMDRGLSATALAAALAVGTAVQAQAVGDFQLQPGTPSPSPAAGPTDSTVPSPTPQPSVRPSPTPVTIPAATPTPRPSPASTPSPRATPRPVATPAPRPTAAVAASPAASAPAPTESAPAPEATETAPPSEAATPAPATRADEGFPGWLLGVIAAVVSLLLGYGGYLLGRRSGKTEPADDWPETPAEPAPTPAPQPAPPAALPPLPSAAPEPAPRRPAPTAPTPAATRPFEMTLEPLRMTMAMINASLTYRLTIASRDGTPLGPLRITCDLIPAHASLQAAEAIVPDPAQPWQSHDFEALPAGEALVVNGEVRLPRTEIVPVRSGANLLFVPLARFTVQTLANGAPETIGAGVFVVGEEPDQPGAGLKPFRLNDGTRSYSRIGQREVTIAA